jgi:hypothetical protein
MPGKGVHVGVLVAVALLLAAPASAGLRIWPVFRGGEPPSNMDGGGNLEEIFKAAAEAWESVFETGRGHWDVTIEFRWGRSTHAWANAVFLTQHGRKPVRVTKGEIIFQNAPPAPGFFADATPRDSTEYKQYSSYLLPDAPVNRGRIFSQATGAAKDRIDLFTIALHEIGHLLGLVDEYVGYQQLCGVNPACTVTVTSPRPHAGLEILVAFGPHMAASFDDRGNPLMVPDPVPGERQLISGVDALLIAEISSFDAPDLTVEVPAPW